MVGAPITVINHFDGHLLLILFQWPGTFICIAITAGPAAITCRWSPAGGDMFVWPDIDNAILFRKLKKVCSHLNYHYGRSYHWRYRFHRGVTTDVMISPGQCSLPAAGLQSDNRGELIT
ncbi:MAG: hypothetical protein ACLTGI_05330 [Hoylesella buccalis]